MDSEAAHLLGSLKSIHHAFITLPCCSCWCGSTSGMDKDRANDIAAGRGGTRLSGAWYQQRGFLLISITSAQLFFLITPIRHVFLVATDPNKLDFFSGSKFFECNWEKKAPTNYTTCCFSSGMVFRPSVPPGSQASCKYDYDKYFRCMARGPLHKTLRDQGPGLTGQIGPAALPGD